MIPQHQRRVAASAGPRPVSTERAIELRGLTKTYRGHLGIGGRRSVDGLDLDVRRGESFGLLGPNGAGKTTTLKMILGLLRPDAGSIRLLGQPPSDPAARARIGYLPEHPYFYDYLTAEEFLDFYGRLQGLPRSTRRAQVRRTLERVGLAGRERTALRKFSKGMVQRLGLAQAIQHDPDLVILDEPMSGLDPIGRREVRDLILDLRAAGKTIFFSSHILQDAELLCDRVAILKQGKLVAVGRLDELVSREVRWYEASIRGPLPDGFPGEPLTVNGDTSLVRIPDVEALSVAITLSQASGAEILSIWPRQETLEDLFLRRIRESGAAEGTRP